MLRKLSYYGSEEGRLLLFSEILNKIKDNGDLQRRFAYIFSSTTSKRARFKLAMVLDILAKSESAGVEEVVNRFCLNLKNEDFVRGLINKLSSEDKFSGTMHVIDHESHESFREFSNSEEMNEIINFVLKKDSSSNSDGPVQLVSSDVNFQLQMANNS